MFALSPSLVSTLNLSQPSFPWTCFPLVVPPPSPQGWGGRCVPLCCYFRTSLPASASHCIEHTGCIRTSHVDQASSKLTESSASASHVLRLKVSTTTPNLGFFFSFILLLDPGSLQLLFEQNSTFFSIFYFAITKLLLRMGRNNKKKKIKGF